MISSSSTTIINSMSISSITSIYYRVIISIMMIMYLSISLSLYIYIYMYIQMHTCKDLEKLLAGLLLSEQGRACAATASPERQLVYYHILYIQYMLHICVIIWYSKYYSICIVCLLLHIIHYYILQIVFATCIFVFVTSTKHSLVFA